MLLDPRRDAGSRWIGRADPGRGGDARLTHVDEGGRPDGRRLREGRTVRTAIATGRVRVIAEPSSSCCAARDVPKGDALAVARIAGIMAAKRTPDLDPAVPSDRRSGRRGGSDGRRRRRRDHGEVRTTDRTGVEMEALTAVAVAGLTVIDMVKAVDPAAVITESGWRRRPAASPGTGIGPGDADDRGSPVVCVRVQSLRGNGRRCRASRRRLAATALAGSLPTCGR